MIDEKVMLLHQLCWVRKLPLKLQWLDLSESQNAWDETHNPHLCRGLSWQCSLSHTGLLVKLHLRADNEWNIDYPCLSNWTESPSITESLDTIHQLFSVDLEKTTRETNEARAIHSRSPTSEAKTTTRPCDINAHVRGGRKHNDKHRNSLKYIKACV